MRRDATTEHSRLRKDRDYWRSQADTLQVEVDGLKNNELALQAGKEAEASAHGRQLRQLKSECDDLKAKHAEQGEEFTAARTRCEILVRTQAGESVPLFSGSQIATRSAPQDLGPSIRRTQAGESAPLSSGSQIAT